MTSYAFSILAWAAVIASTAAGCVQLVRLIPWVGRQMMAGKKPWVCDLCMSFWSTLLADGFWTVWQLAYDRQLYLSAVPAFALTLLLTRALGEPTSVFNLEDIPEMPPDTEDKP